MSVKESYAGKINRKLNKKLRVIAVAAGREPADLVLKNATYVNVFSNELCHGDIAVAEGLIVGMGEYSGAVEVDVSGKIVLPGFVDAHIHLESSLVSPTEFAKAVLPHGTTTVILQVQIVVEYPGGIHGHRRAGFVVGYGIFTVFLIEEQIGAPQTFGRGDGERAAVRCRYADGPELLIQNRPGIRKAGALGAGAFFRHIPGLLGPGQHRQGQQKAEQEEGVDQLFQRNHRLNYFCIDYSPDSIKSKQAFFWGC